ncbi:MAG: hypothetical protein QOF73_3125, partial [Thermomicrobiales bacterium]|nr:hypothetical protein [Thermomicrobiales bacterium]
VREVAQAAADEQTEEQPDDDAADQHRVMMLDRAVTMSAECGRRYQAAEGVSRDRARSATRWATP